MRKQKLGEIARRYSDTLTAADVLTDGVCVVCWHFLVSLLRDLKHANIVTLHDIIHTDSCLTLVFEYLVCILCVHFHAAPQYFVIFLRYCFDDVGGRLASV